MTVVWSSWVPPALSYGVRPKNRCHEGTTFYNLGTPASCPCSKEHQMISEGWCGLVKLALRPLPVHVRWDHRLSMASAKTYLAPFLCTNSSTQQRMITPTARHPLRLEVTTRKANHRFASMGSLQKHKKKASTGLSLFTRHCCVWMVGATPISAQISLRTSHAITGTPRFR